MRLRDFSNAIQHGIREAAARIADEEIKNAQVRIETRLRDEIKNIAIEIEDAIIQQRDLAGGPDNKDLRITIKVDMRGVR